ncbi:AAA family ATPase [Streptosporangium sp. CA-115845]|uniref:AAA family ATPase n=1 Tax=Streptosporangium sp. CA-115845 TaxID=3240071 RepID=UPI003D8DDBE9
MPTGSDSTLLITLRGNSASGKTSLARAVRTAYGYGLALVSQDVIRRELLREKDRPDGVNIGLIDTIVRHCLDRGYHVILEGIFFSGHYGRMLRALRDDHRGSTYGFYFHVPFAETMRRHTTKPQADEYGEAEMRQWYREWDLLADSGETIIEPDSSLETSVQQVLEETGLMRMRIHR